MTTIRYVLTVTPDDTDNPPITERYTSAYDLQWALGSLWDADLSAGEFAELLDGDTHEAPWHTLSVELEVVS